MVQAREQLKRELQAHGYKVEILKDWQPKATLWRHRPMMNLKGTVVQVAGTQVGPLPGNPDSLNRYAYRGMLNYPPAESCRCPWCRKRDWTKPAAQVGEEWQEDGTGVGAFAKFVPPPTKVFEVIEKAELPKPKRVKGRSPKPQLTCDECDYVTKEGALRPDTALKLHGRTHTSLAGYKVNR